MKKTFSEAGDTITIEEVRGPSEKWIIGGTYEVKGTYQLASRERAMLAAFVTISASERDVHPDPLPEQTVVVSRGQGRFTLRFHMWQKGDPHVSFYPAEGGESFGGVFLKCRKCECPFRRCAKRLSRSLALPIILSYVKIAGASPAERLLDQTRSFLSRRFEKAPGR